MHEKAYYDDSRKKSSGLSNVSSNLAIKAKGLRAWIKDKKKKRYQRLREEAKSS